MREQTGRPTFGRHAGACPVCGEERADLVDFGEGVGESPPRLGHEVEYHWYIRYGDQYGGARGNVCPRGTHPAHCTARRCDKQVERIYKEL